VLDKHPFEIHYLVAVARTWLSIRVELVEGRGQLFWPRPGRDFVVARTHSFGQLARAVDIAFARWDLAHMHMFTLFGGACISALNHWDGDEPEGTVDSGKTKFGKLKPGDQFAYVFDFGDEWAHVCTVGAERVDPLELLGYVPDGPTPYWGWGVLPDQYGRGWDDDGDVAPKPPKPVLSDLPPILPLWGKQRRARGRA